MEIEMEFGIPRIGELVELFATAKREKKMTV
jgi:hypothetical protein